VPAIANIRRFICDLVSGATAQGGAVGTLLFSTVCRHLLSVFVIQVRVGGQSPVSHSGHAGQSPPSPRGLEGLSLVFDSGRRGQSPVWSRVFGRVGADGRSEDQNVMMPLPPSPRANAANASLMSSS
jgi:hypothetical protein